MVRQRNAKARRRIAMNDNGTASICNAKDEQGDARHGNGTAEKGEA